MKLRVVSTPSTDLVHLNLVYSNDIKAKYVTLQPSGLIFLISNHPNIEAGAIALNNLQRKSAKVSPQEIINVEPYLAANRLMLGDITLNISTFVKMPITIDVPKLIEKFTQRYNDHIFTIGQEIIMDFEGSNLGLKVMDLTQLNSEMQANNGAVTPFINDVIFRAGGNIKLINNPYDRISNIFKSDFNLNTLGIGGLSSQFTQIFRRAFASRICPQSLLNKFGEIKHCKGILLFGPSGTGKTLLARQIGKMLNCKEPKVVNGPEILNKYVGATEQNIRDMFDEAENDPDQLHLIIFDEIDAICRQRGNINVGINDSIVNQLLSKMDGINQVNNVLVIGITNRVDLIDDALKRPGRFEVQVEIGLPDEKGRHEIFSIHTETARKNGLHSEDIDLADLAKRTKNYSGAEIEGAVRSAISFALSRQLDLNDLKRKVDASSILVTLEDFDRALQEVRPAFGKDDQLAPSIINYGAQWINLVDSVVSTIVNNKNDLITILLQGAKETGKTSLAVHASLLSEAPFVKVINGELLLGYPEVSKINIIRKIFDDAVKSEFSIIVLDDIERLIEYHQEGPRFSNTVLQALMVLMKKKPLKKLVIIGTAESIDMMNQLGFNFQLSFEVESVNKVDYPLVTKSLNVNYDLDSLPDKMPIKTLINVLKMPSEVTY